MTASATSLNATHAAAVSYTASGLVVIPIRRDGTKAATIKEWPQRGLATPADLKNWYGCRQPLGIGIVCGKESGNAETIDIDDADLFLPYCELVEKQAPGLIGRLTIEKTPRPAYGIRYRCPEIDIPGNLKLAQYRDEEGKLHTLIETRGAGGYFLAPGCPPECHHSGRLYEYHSGPPLAELANITAGEREILISSARSFDRTPPQTKPDPQRNGAATVGGDYDQRGPDWSEILGGWDCIHVAGEVRHWRRPGKAVGGCSATTGYCKGAAGEDLLRVFSTNAPLQPGSYGKFRTFALLHHAGDFKAAAKALRATGYGTSTAKQPTSNGEQVNEVPDDIPIRQTDRGNALRLCARHGADLRYCHPWGQWLVWDGARWAPDATGAAMRRAKETITAAYRETAGEITELGKQLAAAADDETKAKLETKLNTTKRTLTWFRQSEQAPRLNAMLELCRSDLPIPIKTEHMDKHPMLLNVLNGTIDLETGKLYAHRRGDFLTRVCPAKYFPEAPCPTWLGFHQSILNGDEELMEFSHRVLGYAITALNTEDLIVICYGAGSNGKTTYVETMHDVLGEDYSTPAPVELLMHSTGQRHPTEKMVLHGKRFVSVAETPQGGRLNAHAIKAMTSRDRIVGRRVFENVWSFMPSHKLFIATNHRPVIGDNSVGMWRRLRLLPFEVRFHDPANAPPDTAAHLLQDKGLAGKLRAEREGILAWLVKGALAWKRNGLPMPGKVQAATASYQADEDLVGQFLDECCTQGPECSVKASVLYKAFGDWCDRGGLKKPGQRSFGEGIGERAVRYTSNGTWYQGIQLVEDGP